MFCIRNNSKLICTKDVTTVKQFYQTLIHYITSVKSEMDRFISTCFRESEKCQYKELFLQYGYYLKDLIVADSNGDLDGYFQSVQNLMSQFQECDSINYIRYPSLHLLIMRYLHKKYTEISRKFKSGHFAVKN